MPFKSKAQMKYMFAHKKELGSKVVSEFAKATSKKKMKRLPEHAKKK